MRIVDGADFGLNRMSLDQLADDIVVRYVENLRKESRKEVVKNIQLF